MQNPPQLQKNKLLPELKIILYFPIQLTISPFSNKIGRIDLEIGSLLHIPQVVWFLVIEN